MAFYLFDHYSKIVYEMGLRKNETKIELSVPLKTATPTQVVLIEVTK